MHYSTFGTYSYSEYPLVASFDYDYSLDLAIWLQGCYYSHLGSNIVCWQVSM